MLIEITKAVNYYRWLKPDFTTAEAPPTTIHRLAMFAGKFLMVGKKMITHGKNMKNMHQIVNLSS